MTENRTVGNPEDQAVEKSEERPQRDAKGHFLPGHKRVGGRQKGGSTKIVKLRNALLGALDKLGGEKWIVEAAKCDPPAFVRVLASLLPKQHTVEEERALTVIIKGVEPSELPKGEDKPALPGPAPQRALPGWALVSRPGGTVAWTPEDLEDNEDA